MLSHLEIFLPTLPKNQKVHLTPYRAKVICYAGIVKRERKVLQNSSEDQRSWISLQYIEIFFPMPCLQWLVIGRSGENGPSATPLGPMARSSDFVTATTLLRLLPVMAIQLRRLLAQSLVFQVAYSMLNSFFCWHRVIQLFSKSYSPVTPSSQDGC